MCADRIIALHYHDMLRAAAGQGVGVGDRAKYLGEAVNAIDDLFDIDMQGESGSPRDAHNHRIKRLRALLEVSREYVDVHIAAARRICQSEVAVAEMDTDVSKKREAAETLADAEVFAAPQSAVKRARVRVVFDRTRRPGAFTTGELSK